MLIVYGKKKCGLCSATKEKLDRMGIPYESRDFEAVTDFHADWREQDSCAVLAAYMLHDTLPIIRDGRDFLTYPQLMRRLKGRETPPGEGALTQH